MKIKVQEQFASSLPEILHTFGKGREFEVLMKSKPSASFSKGRFLLHVPEGGYSLDHILPSWWVPQDHCEVLEGNSDTIEFHPSY